MRPRPFVYQIPPFSLMAMLLMYLLSCMGEIGFALHNGEWGSSLPLIAGDGLLTGVLAWKAVRKHLFAHLFDRHSSKRIVLLDICPAGLAMVGAAYLLKALGLTLLALEHQEPRCLFESLNEFVLVTLLVSRLFTRRRMNRGRLLGRRADLASGHRPMGPAKDRNKDGKNKDAKRA